MIVLPSAGIKLEIYDMKRETQVYFKLKLSCLKEDFKEFSLLWLPKILWSHPILILQIPLKAAIICFTDGIFYISDTSVVPSSSAIGNFLEKPRTSINERQFIRKT